MYQYRFLGFLALLILAGCANTVRVSGDWQEGVSHRQSFSRVLIVGVSNVPNNRCNYEHFLATQVSSEFVSATPSCNFMPIDDPLTIESVEAAIAESGADAVVSSILVASQLGTETGATRDARGGGYYKATGTGYEDPLLYRPYYRGGYGMWGVPVTYVEFEVAPPVTTIDGEVDIVSRIYRVEAAQLVYEMVVSASHLQSTETAMADVSIAVANELRDKGLTR